MKVIQKPAPLVVKPLTDKEKKLAVANALMKEANALTNQAKERQYELQKLRQRIAHLRAILAPPKKPTKKVVKKVAKKAATKEPVAKQAPAKVVTPA